MTSCRRPYNQFLRRTHSWPTKLSTSGSTAPSRPPLLRNKTKILDDGVTQPPIWGFDGSSTEQATGDKSDCVLKPVFTCPDPIRGGRNILVLCEVLLASNMRPHPTNTRAAAAAAAKKYADDEMIFGIEQEYTMLKPDGTPLGFPDGGGFPGPQGPYYCGVGADRIVGRDIVEEHTQACIDAGLEIAGTNAEVMPGQWEFQIGPADVTEVSDHLNVARWLLHRIAEDYDVVISFAAKPQKGDWNGAGCHTNFSTKAMRESYQAVIAAVEAIGKNDLELVKNYGARHREPPHRRPRDRAVEQVQLRRVRPRCVDPHPVAGREGRQGLRRGPPPERQLRPVRRDPPDHRDGVRRAPRRPPGRHAAKKPAAKKVAAKK